MKFRSADNMMGLGRCGREGVLESWPKGVIIFNFTVTSSRRGGQLSIILHVLLGV